MPQYRVIWEIDCWAATPRLAALWALTIMQDPESDATVFDVTDESGEKHRIDLLDEEEM